MNFFSTAKGRGVGRTLLIDIGSAAVRVALLEENTHGIHISKTALYDIPYKKTLTARALKKSAISALICAMLEQKEWMSSADACYISLGAPWYESEIIDVAIPEAHVSLKAAHARIVKERLAMAPTDMECFEVVPLVLEKNGYRVPETCTVLGTGTMRILSSQTPTAFLDEIRQTLGHALEARLKGVYTHAHLIMATLARAPSIREASCTALHITGEITEVFMIDRGVLTAIATFPRGYRTLVRALDTSTHGSDEVAVSGTVLAEKNMLDEKGVRTHKEAHDRESALWVQAMHGVVASLGNGLPLPARAYLFTDKKWEDTYMRACTSPVAPTRTAKIFSHGVVCGVIGDHGEGIECEAGMCDNRIMLLAHMII